MAGGGYGTTNFGGPFGQSTATGSQMQIPNFMQPYFGNVMSGPATGQQTQQAQPQNQPFGKNIYGYNLGRLSSMIDPSSTLPQYQQSYQPTYQQTSQTYQPLMNDLFGSIGYLFGQPNFFSSNQAVSPTPAPATETFGQKPGQQFDTSALEKQIKDLQDQIAAMNKPQTSSAETVADLGIGHKEQGVIPGNVASDTKAAPSPETPAPPPSALKTGVGFRDINTQYGGMLGNVNATVDNTGRVVLASNTNKNIKTTLPAGSYFDSTKKQFVDASGNVINLGSQFLSSTAPETASAGIQFGDTAADIRREFGNVVNVTDRAKINPDGSITLGGGTKIPSNSYVDSSGVLRQPNGSPVTIKPSDVPVVTTQAPTSAAANPAAPTPAPAATPAPTAATPTPAPAAASTAASTNPITQAQAINAIRAQGFAINRDPSGKPWTSQSLANALGQTIKVGNRTFTPQTVTAKKGGIIHIGMTNRLKHMTRD